MFKDDGASSRHDDSERLYNSHSKIPAAGAVLATPVLKKAVQKVNLDGNDEPVLIADYGSSQGKNSLGPMRTVIRSLRIRVGPNRPIVVVHIDQPSNNFNSLFETLRSDPERYVLEETNVFPGAIGRSFYEQVLPPNSVHIAWCSYAAVWLSQVPSVKPGHIFSLCNSGAERAAFESQAAKDWETFLSLRAREMRIGARLVVVLPGVADDQLWGFREFMDHATVVLEEMVAEGAMTAEERAGMVIGSYPRRKSELLAPFQKEGRFQNLIVEDCDTSVLRDPIWADYKEDGDAETLARKQALRFRTIYMPSLTSTVSRLHAGEGEALRNFADRLEEGMTRRVARNPVRTDSLVQTIVLARF